RNYIEGLFLSSGIIRSPDYTMEQIVEVARILREEYDFRGYMHLKTIPEAAPELIAEAGRHADRVSINVELPTANSLKTLAPEKDREDIEGAMAKMRVRIEEAKRDKTRRAKKPTFAPGGQSTQMIVGADSENDASVLTTATDLYDKHRLRRVYYSAYSPIPDAKPGMPANKPPLIREHRLYQADWLTRFYGFGREEIISTMIEGMLDLTADPKLIWALKNQGFFPIDVNRATKEELLRIPGIGTRGVQKILMARRYGALRYDDLARLAASVKRIRPFVTTPDWRPTALLDSGTLEARMKKPAEQQDLFAAA
ncbi:MAG: putative DNA modification/repair radical SAM protein, partial [Pseudomonadota bacterium]